MAWVAHQSHITGIKNDPFFAFLVFFAVYYSPCERIAIGYDYPFPLYN